MINQVGGGAVAETSYGLRTFLSFQARAWVSGRFRSGRSRAAVVHGFSEEGALVCRQLCIGEPWQGNERGEQQEGFCSHGVKLDLCCSAEGELGSDGACAT